jgi:hypothetical protein
VVIGGSADIGLEGFQSAKRRWQRMVLLLGLRVVKPQTSGPRIAGQGGAVQRVHRGVTTRAGPVSVSAMNSSTPSR